MADIRIAYSEMLKQIKSGDVDDNFVDDMVCVYTYALAAEEDMRKQMAAELYGALSEHIEKKMGLAPLMFSYLLQMDHSIVYMEDFLRLLRAIQQGGHLEWQNAYYLFAQLNLLRLQYEDCDSEDVRGMLSELMRHAVIRCMMQLNVAVRPVSYKERDERRVVVLTEELVSEDSAWLELVLDCCYQLQHELGREVLLINTAEAASRAGEVRFFKAQYGREDTALSQQTQMEWKGEQISCFSCPEVLSSPGQIEEALEKILGYKPGLVIHLGDNSFLAGLVDQWIPVMAMGRSYGRYVVSGAEFEVAYDSEAEILAEFLPVVRNYEQIVEEGRDLRARLVLPAKFFEAEERNVGYCEIGESDSYLVREGRKNTWAAALGILKEISRICAKYDITYYAYKGTLLGAVRHEGFIPWDEDIDIAMKKEDYQRFVDAAEKELGKQYCLMDASVAPDWNDFKIQVLYAADAACLLAGEDYSARYLPAVDIFVLYHMPEDDARAESQKKRLADIFDLARELDDEGVLSEESMRRFEELRTKYVCNITPSESIRNQLVQIQQQIADEVADDAATSLYSCVDYGKRREWYIYKQEWFECTEYLSFEDQMLPVPQAHQEILDILYFRENWRKPFRWWYAAGPEKKDCIVRCEDLSGAGELPEEIKIHYSGYIEYDKFFIESMMKRAWAASLKVLKEIERICRRHAIPYYADWGTLLGAVRHKGFVPWDDDIDIAMKREDYNRFVVAAREELPDGYCIVDAAFDEDWPNLLPRVINVQQSKRASEIEVSAEKREEFYGCPFPIGVDIFPLDYIPREKEKADMHRTLLAHVLRLLILVDKSRNEMTEEIQQEMTALGEVCHYQFTEDDSLSHQLFGLGNAIAQAYGAEEADELTYVYSYVRRPGFRLKKEWYDDCVSLPFETTTIMAPKEYKKILRVMFGDWHIYCKGAGAAHEYPFYKKMLEELERQGIQL